MKSATYIRALLDHHVSEYNKCLGKAIRKSAHGDAAYHTFYSRAGAHMLVRDVLEDILKEDS